MPIATIITGDLIRSRATSPAKVDAAIGALRDAAHAFGSAHDIDLRFTRFRGDGWQIHLIDARHTLDAIVFLHAHLRAQGAQIDTRMAAATGTIDTIGTADLSDGSGPAFFVSGDLLEKMPRTRRITIAGTGIDPKTIAIFDLIELVIFGWTAAQAQAASSMLLSPNQTQDNLAQQLGITRQAVQSRLASAGYSHLESALYAIQMHDFSGDAP